MSKNLTATEFEQLRRHLIVPLAVSDILKHDLNVDSDMHYGLHMALSEVDPDSALLAIALCALDIAHKAGQISPMAGTLQKEAMDILSDYAPSWMRKNLNAPLPSYVYEEILETVPEDLESLADLMDALYVDIDDETNEISILIKLLSIQARAHMEIADFVLAEIAYEKKITTQPEARENLNFTYEGYDITAHQEEETKATDNIIVFPGTRN